MLLLLLHKIAAANIVVTAAMAVVVGDCGGGVVEWLKYSFGFQKEFKRFQQAARSQNIKRFTFGQGEKETLVPPTT